MANIFILALLLLAVSGFAAARKPRIPDDIPLDKATRDYLELLSPADLAAILEIYQEATVGQVAAPTELITQQEVSFYGKSLAVYPSRTLISFLVNFTEYFALTVTNIAEAKGTGSWADAYSHAKALVDQMTNEEKAKITTGVFPLSTYCGGEVAGVSRLGFPGMCLNDGPNGLHSLEAVTAYASGITIGASWNKDLALARAQQMGKEARRKGGQCLHYLILYPCWYLCS